HAHPPARTPPPTKGTPPPPNPPASNTPRASPSSAGTTTVGVRIIGNQACTYERDRRENHETRTKHDIPPDDWCRACVSFGPGCIAFQKSGRAFMGDPATVIKTGMPRGSGWM